MATKKAKPVKWALGGSEPEDLDDFLSNDDIVKKNKKRGEVLWPSKGPHTLTVKRLLVKPNKNGDPRISAMLIMQNPKKAESAVWNGYLIWDGFNVENDGGPGLRFLKRFLLALGLTWDDFLNKTKAVDEDGERSQIVQIGRVKFGESATKDPVVRATVVVKPADDYNDDEHLEVKSYLALADDEEEEEDDDDADETEAEDFSDEEDEDEDEDADDEDEEDDEEEEDEDEEDEDEDEEEEDDEAEELREELKGLTLPNLKKRAMRALKKAKVDPDDVEVPSKKAALVEWLVSVEMGEPPF